MEIAIQIFFNSVIAGSIYLLVGLGFWMIYKTVKFFDLGYGALITIGAYGTFWAYKILGLSLFPSVALGIVLAAVLSFLLERFVYRPLRRRKASNMVLLVASLGIFTMGQAIVAILFSSQFKVLQKGTQQVFEILGAFITMPQVIIISSAILLAIALFLFLKYSMIGKSLKAISDDEEVSKIVGINTNRFIAYAFLIGGALAGYSGIMAGFDTGIEPTMGMNLLLKGVIAVIIGGMRNIWGVVLGAFLLGFVENLVVWYWSGEWKDAVAFGVLIIFLLFRPKGIFQ